MQDDQQQRAAQAKEESLKQKHDADSGNDGSSNEILQKENLIDPGNEHHHSKGNIKHPSKHDADSGSDATGTTGPEPGEGENDAPDTSGEAG